MQCLEKGFFLINDEFLQCLFLHSESAGGFLTNFVGTCDYNLTSQLTFTVDVGFRLGIFQVGSWFLLSVLSRLR
ncbi:hypothetical protein L6164_010965 [Bauhinia variegata]|uniref:Uncharacterized protein n=1 Tax=Bauhinia variegata TaxID=167791 RepID=A0ACB9P6I3_BAUVA|nr:hypothetical protein L6164_010965 [Bauhinia variegata]